MRTNILKLIFNAKTSLNQYVQENPATAAAAQQAIGGVLIADGLVGLENPFDNKKSRPGIFGTIYTMAFSLIFIFGVPFVVGQTTGLDRMTEETTGQVLAVGEPVTRTDSDGDTSTTCGITVAYTVNGQSYERTSSMASSGNCNRVAGDSVTVNYNPDNPVEFMTDKGILDVIINIFRWVGIFILASSVATFFLRLASIIFGWVLFKRGRDLAATLPADTNFETIKTEIKENFTGSLFGYGRR